MKIPYDIENQKHCLPDVSNGRLQKWVSGVGQSHVFDFMSELSKKGAGVGLRRAVLGLELVREEGAQV